MTVDQLIARWQKMKTMLPELGNAEVLIFDPDTEEWEPVGGYTYGADSPVKLYPEEY